MKYHARGLKQALPALSTQVDRPRTVLHACIHRDLGRHVHSVTESHEQNT